jgi:hypothetical protein
LWPVSAHRALGGLVLLATLECAGAGPALGGEPLVPSTSLSPSLPPANPAVDEKTVKEVDYFTRRYEPAAFPILGGNSDIGFEFGVAGTLSWFADGVAPYRWNMDLLVTPSLKSDPTGKIELAQQAYLWDIDVPGLAGGRLRVNPFVEFRRTINQGYFGLGNVSSAVRPAASTGRYFEYIHEEGGVRQMTRYRLLGPYNVLSSTIARYVDPTPYPGSKLAEDEIARAPNGSPFVLGVQKLAIVSEAAGLLYDSRDSEIFTRTGWLDQVGLRFSQAFPLGAGITFGEAEATAATYVRLAGPFVLAVQGAADFKFGHVPFFELFTGGVFNPDYMIGGSAAIRGVPFGRYLGQIKAVGNLEIRALPVLRVHVLGQHFQLGNNVFFDTGRVWSDYTFHSPLDGNGLGLKWGIGAGVYLLWGQAAMFRLEVAYSPDAVSENPNFPVGLYIEDGLSF